MENKDEIQPLKVVHVVTFFQNLVGVHASPEEAFTVMMDLVNKGRPAKLETMPVIYPANFKA